MPKRKMFLYCQRCNKKLVERLPNGLFKFVFGRDKEKRWSPPVQLLIHGSIKIRCFRRMNKNGEPVECGCWNTFYYFPKREIFDQRKVDSSIGKDTEVLAHTKE